RTGKIAPGGAALAPSDRGRGVRRVAPFVPLPVFFTPRRRPTAHRLLGRHSRDVRARREYAMTLRVTAWVQVALAVALVAGAGAPYQAIERLGAAAKPPVRRV